jgi:dolichol-phosphate mannosyltransferase
MAHRTWQEGFRILEVPITFTERASGESKMSKQIMAEALWRATLWALTGGRRRSRPRHPRASLSTSGSAATALSPVGTMMEPRFLPKGDHLDR